MNTKYAIATLLVLAVLGAGGYATYTYLKEKPPHFLINLLTKTKAPPPLPEGDAAPFQVPEGYSMTIFSRDVPHARVMTRDPKGTLLMTTAGDSDGKVVALPDLNGDGKADRVVAVLSGLSQPHGITVICPDTVNESAGKGGCVLYVAETGSLKSYSYDADTLSASDPKELAVLPTGSGHFTRTLLPTKDNTGLYVSVGSDCNVCNEANPKLRATIQTFDLATQRLSTFATGLRNSVFMAFNPVTGDLWATDNGRDVLGQDIPPDEVNIVREGGDYGWPTCYGQNLHDTDFDHAKYEGDPCAGKLPPHIELPAHSAPLGLAFIPEEGWPDGWGNDLLVALHGSWNRKVPSGYKVVRVHLDAQGNQDGPLEDFATGFLPAGSKDTDDVIGRPVGLLAEPGGTLYISDDRQGAIYKVAKTAQ